MRYEQVFDGEWTPIGRRRYPIACCDCGLVHRVDVRTVKGRLEIRAYRDRPATAALRRSKFQIVARAIRRSASRLR